MNIVNGFLSRTCDYKNALFLEASVLVGNREAAELLMNRFSGIDLCTTGLHHPTCIALHLGGAAALLERHDEAREHYKEAIRVCTEMVYTNLRV